MTFQHPEILYGLFAIAIPILIHLFNFRRYKKLYFSDISRLKRVTTQTKKQHKFKHLVILLLRIISIASIVIAFANPQLKNKNDKVQPETGTIAIYTDNSFSMLAEGENGRLFEEARQNAMEIIVAAPENTKFIILNGKNQNTTLTQQEALSLMENLEISENITTLSQIIEDRNRLMKLKEIGSCNTYILSDAQSNIFDFERLQPDSVNNYTFIVFKHLFKRNIFVDSCNIQIPELIKNRLINLHTRIENPSDEDYSNIPVKVFINEKQKAVSGIDLESNSYIDVEFSFNNENPGWNYGVVQIEDYPITFDDKLYFSYQTLPLINVLIISNKSNNRIQQYYESDKIFNPVTTDYLSADYTNLNKYNLVVINANQAMSSGIVSQLESYVNNGGNILFIPDLDENISITNDFLTAVGVGSVTKKDTALSRVTRIATTDNIFQKSISNIPENADLPVIYNHFVYKFPVSSGVESLITLLSGDDLLSRKRIGNGNLYIFSAGINNQSGNFSVHPLFVPVMHGIVEKITLGEKPYLIIGDDKYVNIKLETRIKNDKPVILKNMINDQVIIPAQRLHNGMLRLELTNIPLEAGFYDVINNDTIISVLATNYNRSESTLNFLTEEEIISNSESVPFTNFSLIDNSSNELEIVINSLQNQSNFWKLFIIFALFALLIEIIVIRFWK